uniref:DNA polymerase III subunit gamma and tau n=1 Tax=Piscicoccus intestinalis TaxID=746033 RepID=UPI0008392282
MAPGVAAGGATALYRRYRPQTFEDVIGQEHVTGPLMQALRSGRIGHAYLFSGPRGCGKTTSARILARCLNCAQGPTPTPCGECDSCVALARGGAGSVDVIEIDAASHGGVEDARDLREKASYGPAQSRYKIYIIDEAHMVTPQGFNALLKIVEEPPEHVKFVFATTEPEKVIGTIRSRTHHYPFRLVPPARLQDYLAQLCEAEQIPVEPGVLSFVIRAGGGSVRDSLSVLDQLMAGSDETGLTYAGAAALLGFTEGELLDATIDALAAGDGASVFRQVDRTIETGQDPRRFVEDLLQRLRDLIVISAVSASGGDIDALFRGLPSDQLDRMRQQASSFGPGELSHAADVVNAGLTEMSGATSPRLQLELICARLLLPGSAGEHGLIARVDRMERRLDLSGASAPPVGPQSAGRGAGPGVAAGAAAEPGPGAGPAADAAADDRADAGAPGVPSSRRPASQPDPTTAPGAGAPNAGGERQAAMGGSRPEAGAPGGAPGDGHGDGRSGEPRRPEGPVQEQRESPATPPRGRGGLDTDAIRRSWPDVLGKVFTIRRVTWTFLSEHAQVLDYDGRRLLLGIATRGLAATFRSGQHGEVVRQALIDAIGLDATVEAVPIEDARQGGGGHDGGGVGPAHDGRSPRPSGGAGAPTGRAPQRGAGPRSAPGSHDAPGDRDATGAPGAAGARPQNLPSGHARQGNRDGQAQPSHDRRGRGGNDRNEGHWDDSGGDHGHDSGDERGEGPSRRPAPGRPGSDTGRPDTSRLQADRSREGRQPAGRQPTGRASAGRGPAGRTPGPGPDSGAPAWHEVEPPDDEPGWDDWGPPPAGPPSPSPSPGPSPGPGSSALPASGGSGRPGTGDGAAN